MKHALHAGVAGLLLIATSARAQTAPATDSGAAPPAPAAGDAVQLQTVQVTASADASAQGLSPAYPGGQVARGGRAGILGTRDNLETPYSITAYTNELIQDRQARSVGDVLQADPSVRTARGFGNFQEAYIIRGFVLSSDDVAYNGLYSLLPRQYIATELFERVEVLRGASAFLNGASPGGNDGIGGAINLLPKRAGNEPLTRFTVGGGNGPQENVAADIGRRFGANNAFGLRFNAAFRDGSAIDEEKSKLGVASLGADWHGDNARLSADIGYQDNHLDQTRPNVSLSGVTHVPDAPDASKNFAQPWSYSNERDLFGTLRGEYDFNRTITAYAAYGLRRSAETNSLASLTVSNADTGAGTTYRFDNTRRDHVDTGSVGLRGKFDTGPIGNEWVVDAGFFRLTKKNAYEFDYKNTLATNLYNPTGYAQPAFSANAIGGNQLGDPGLTNRSILESITLGDTLSAFDKRLLVTLGARYQKFDISNFAYTSAKPAPGYDNGRLSPSGGVVWRLSRQVSLYANYIEGMTQGDIAPASNTNGSVVNAGDQLPPYVSRQEEIGAKFDAGRIAGGVALFNTSLPQTSINSAQVFSADGHDRHRGVEANVYGIAARGLRVLGGVTWLEATQQSSGADEGLRVIGVPRWQGSLGGEYDLPFLRALTFDARVLYTGASYYDAANTMKVDGWTRLDMGARYQLPLGSRLLTLRARVDNVANENYWASSGGYPGSSYLVAGAPRTFGLSAAMDF